LLDLSDDDFTTLLHDCTTEIEVPNDDECGSTEGTSAAAAAAAAWLSEGPLPVEPAAPRVIKEQTAGRSDRRGKAVEVRKVFLCPEYLAAVRKEEEQMAKESDCARRGLAYLSEDELIAHIRATLAEQPTVRGFPLSLSLGVASCPPLRSVEAALAAADEGVFVDKAARSAGRR
jgi:hypothetical protein